MDDQWIKNFQQMVLQMKADQVETQAGICALEETLIHAISIMKQSDAAELETYLNERKRFCHDALLRTLQDENPFAAVTLDRREEKDLPTERGDRNE